MTRNSFLPDLFVLKKKKRKNVEIPGKPVFFFGSQPILDFVNIKPNMNFHQNRLTLQIQSVQAKTHQPIRDHLINKHGFHPMSNVARVLLIRSQIPSIVKISA